MVEESRKATIFFNEASKGNLGILGTRGVIYSTDDQRKEIFSWGLG